MGERARDENKEKLEECRGPINLGSQTRLERRVPDSERARVFTENEPS